MGWLAFLKKRLDRPAEIKMRKAKEHLNRGHVEFDKKNYKSAIYQYKTGIDYLKWIDIRIKNYKGDHGFLQVINIMQTLWGWLSKAYREIGADVLANECLETVNYYMDLEKTCKEIALEKRSRLKLRNREFLPMILFYSSLECTIFIAGFFLEQILTNLFVFVSLFIMTVLPSLIYVIFNFHFRKTYAFRYKTENIRTELSRISENEKDSIELDLYFVENYDFLLLFLLFASMLFYLILFMNLRPIINGNALFAYLIMPIIGLSLVILHGIIFWFTDWYEKCPPPIN